MYVSNTAFVNAGNDTLACTSSIQLVGSPVGNAVGNWVAQPPSVAFSNPSDPQTVVTGLQPGSYDFHWVLTEGNCHASDSCHVVVGLPPFAAFSFSTNVFTAIFNNVSQNAIGWQWDFGDGNTSNQQSPTHSYAGNGVYNVCLIATDTCGSDTTCQAVSVSVVDVEKEQNPTFNAWPNPFSRLLSVNVTGLNGESISFVLCDAKGQWLRHGRWDPSDLPMTLDLAELAGGLYFLALQAGEWHAAIKVLKE